MIRICCLVFLTLSATIQAIDVLLMGAMSVGMSIKKIKGRSRDLHSEHGDILFYCFATAYCF